MAAVSKVNQDTKQEENPFDSLKISSFDVLRDAERSTCKKCRSSRKYYCYKCFEVVGLDRTLIPHIRLPFQVDIIKHQGEVIGKSTACHAAILAPDDVTIHHYPTIPKFDCKEKVLLVYPSEDALTLADLGKNNSKDDSFCTFNRVVFIDSTWDQAHSIITDQLVHHADINQPDKIRNILDPKLEDIQRVKLENAVTYFWRPQRKPNTCLATIEAVYYFFKEYDKYIMKREYNGEYDDLLYFFVFQYLLIQKEKQKSKRQKLE